MLKTLGQEGVFAALLAKAAEAQRLAENGVQAGWCERCEADTLPDAATGKCLWCGAQL